MTAQPLERSSAAKAGWVFVVIFLGWLVFVFVPSPKPEPKPPEKLPARPVSKLRLVGLPDNPDLEGLPEIFAIWADHAQWQDDRTQFAYWNPANRSYSYLFEATRRNGKVRFRPITKVEAFGSRAFDAEGNFSQIDDASRGTQPVEPDFPPESSTHPFVFFRRIEEPLSMATGPHFVAPGRSVKVIAPIDVKEPPLPVPREKIAVPSDSDDQTKK
jgi:hypothetical protein